jgi:hypothetical protein
MYWNVVAIDGVIKNQLETSSVTFFLSWMKPAEDGARPERKTGVVKAVRTTSTVCLLTDHCDSDGNLSDICFITVKISVFIGKTRIMPQGQFYDSVASRASFIFFTSRCVCSIVECLCLKPNWWFSINTLFSAIGRSLSKRILPQTLDTIKNCQINCFLCGSRCIERTYSDNSKQKFLFFKIRTFGQILEKHRRSP